MPNSLKAKLSKLRYKGQITNDEYKELIIKLVGHDEQIRADERAKTIEEFFKAITEHTIVCSDGITEIIDVMSIIKVKEQLKEQNKSKVK